MSQQKLEIEVDKALEHLKKGNTILYPTDTVWGIGCDATKTSAVKKIYNIKQRDKSKSLIILVDSIAMLKNYVAYLPESIYAISKNASNPTTVIYPKAKNVAKNAVAADGSIAIRIIKNEFCNLLLKKFGKPIISSSANISGCPTPLVFRKISQEVIKRVNHIVDIDKDRISNIKPSTIIRVDNNGLIEIIRD